MVHLFLLSMAAAASAPADLNRGVNERILADALNAPESKRKPGGRPRYCVFVADHQLVDFDHHSADRRRVCRTQREWRELGVQPVLG